MQTPADLGFNAARFPAFRQGQVKALLTILNTTKRFIMLDAPPGSGKSLVAAALQRLSKQQVVYTATTKSLQDQFMNDFHKLDDGEILSLALKGRSEYPTRLYPHRFPYISAELCTQDKHTECPWCHENELMTVRCLMGHDVRVPKSMIDQSQWTMLCVVCRFGKKSVEELPIWLQHRCPSCIECGYVQAKLAVEDAPIPVLNTSSFLYGVNYGGLWAGRKLPWLVVDEADTLEDAITDFTAMSIGKRWAEKLGIKPPKYAWDESDSVGPHDTAKTWMSWILSEANPAISKELLKYNPYSKDADTIRTIKELSNMKTHLDRIFNQLATEPWVFEPETWTFKPVMAAKHTEKALWDHADKIILMSGTILSWRQMADDLGIETSDVEYIEIPSSYPAARRKVFYNPTISVSMKNRDEALPALTRSVDTYLQRYASLSTIVHTANYTTADYIATNSLHRNRILTYHSARERNGAIAEFRASPAKVIVAPSLTRGVDFPDDATRLIIVCKVAYLNIKDRRVKYRLYGTGKAGKIWYAMQAIRSIVQCTMRGMRHDNDWCISVILDERFGNLLQEYRHMFPKWWLDALVIEQ
jgi:Rad3-related DNA helicase